MIGLREKGIRHPAVRQEHKGARVESVDHNPLVVPPHLRRRHMAT
jgi:hypothetical protein